MKSKQLTLGLGANLGDRHATLAQARELLVDQFGPLIAASQLLQTAAWGRTDQPDFLNQVIIIKWTPPAHLQRVPEQLHFLLNGIQATEAQLGRTRDLHWGPRTCDVDLIFVDDLRYEDERINLPHPWWRERDFVGGIIHRELRAFLPWPGR
ncbi:2-amino-4-hydroxy-6-hydroxymethyldihydropteridine diphosphokinase [Neolewinella lacunae]|uniref:2-amino-4-hydroxy-6-hydroxymethyldihydropteridine pyrophosphokinase n=1 Tax=Neolewinella lacunae TaxID=1517758 RepID=A0A923PJF4_9BACT|nr:2-amino-4-hydroxy-6-hydroxymethyldihydropteridine diphosphokinase [Neolewinella lacunae]MBC6995192.1 2-amino-4-hydroxy-6-hydroxymethyldihydropteridine diphosphokinase [Neolewinella lacunae]MDN3634142.1 2-amino-4-hydroxy-6-hydroxymethyldihydropteridine diphosphokinase [Neolewinella lacunae]